MSGWRAASVVALACLAMAACGKGGGPAPQGDAPAPPGMIPAKHLDRIVDVSNRGVALMDQFNPVGAVGQFEEAVRLAPDWPTGRLNLGIALLNTQTPENFPPAEAAFRRVIAMEPDNPYAHYSLGMLLRHLGRFEEARTHFARVLDIDGTDADAHYQLGALLVDEDPAAARTHLERALTFAPHHESASYRLLTLLSQAGETEAAREQFEIFQRLKQAESGVALALRYGEMGRYAAVVRTFAGTGHTSDAPQRPPLFREVAAEVGLTEAGQGPAGWPGEGLDAAGADPAQLFGPGVAVEDVDGDGDLDIYIPPVGAAGDTGLYLNDGGQFRPAPDAGINGQHAVAGFFGDYDRDGDPDLYLTCAGPNRLYANDGSGRFTDVTEATGTAGGNVLSLGAAWADADHDGDLDLYVANYCALPIAASPVRGVPNDLWRNNGDGTFQEVATAAGIDGGRATTIGVAFFDLDDDRDLDLLVVNDRSANRVFANDRIGRYTEQTAAYPLLADSGPGLGFVVGDVNLDGREDVLLLRGTAAPRLLLNRARRQFVEDKAFSATVAQLGGCVNASLADVDLDGDLDLAVFGAGDAQHRGHYVLLNDGRGRFGAPTPLSANEHDRRTRGTVAADFNGDGALEFLVARSGASPQLWRGEPPPERQWLVVDPMVAQGEDRRPTASGVGLHVEVKTGPHVQVATIRSSSGYLGGAAPQAHFGLGEHGKADYVRLNWPDAVLQSEIEVPAGQVWRVVQMKRKPSSCPVLFTWDGTRFAFVTDFLGVGGLGFFVAPGEYGPPDPTEAVRIPPSLIRERDGRYLMRVAEPLEEIVYLDELHVVAYDHPAEVEIFPDERFASAPPWPTGAPLTVAEKIFPTAARTDREEQVQDRLRTIDRRYIEPPLDPRFVGYAQDHWLELDFGTQLREIDPDVRVILYLYGWVEYTYSHVNYAAYQAGLTMHPPAIEVPDGAGGWRTAIADAGYPAGLPRMMTLDVSALPLREDGRLRLRTNMEIFWDQIFVAVQEDTAPLRRHVLRPSVADLRRLGFPREYSPDGAAPTAYDYHRLDQGVPFKNLTGPYTREGDVRELLTAVDDRFVIMGRGEEIALEFDATALPPLPDGWNRTLVLHSDGFCKDMDLYTAFPDTVGPLPYHAMRNYPPERPAASGAVSASHYARTWNTRWIAGQ